MDESEEGRKVLAGFQKTTQFDKVPPHALDLVNELADLNPESEFAK